VGGGGRLRLGPPRRHATDFDESADDLPDLTIVAADGDGAASGEPVAAPLDQTGARASAVPAAADDLPAASFAPPTLPFAPSAATPVGDSVRPDLEDEPTEIFSWRPLSSGGADDVDPA
jgi:hypothetical protein